MGYDRPTKTMSASIAPHAKPDLAAHEAVIRLALPKVVERLTDELGAKLVAYIGSVTETRAVRQWMTEGNNHREPKGDTSSRLREALTVTLMLRTRDSKGTVQAWLMGLNPQLDDQSPATLLREGDEHNMAAVRGAARAFLIGG
jgi:hypothetical protein